MNKRIKRYLHAFILLLAIAIGAVIILPASTVLLCQIFNLPHHSENISLPNKAQIPQVISIYRHESGIIESIPFEEYVAGVVAGEMPASFEVEALKAQSVAARTYSLSKVIRSGDSGFPEAHPAAPLCDDVHCQVYRSPAELERLKSAQWMENDWLKIKNAVSATSGELMYYGNDIAYQALFHSSSGGSTENSEDVFVSAVPYLRSVSSPYEEDATHKNEKTTLTIFELASKLQSAFPNMSFATLSAENIKILSYTAGGRVESIQLGSEILSGSQIRTLLNLPSANFTLSTSSAGSDTEICFITNGYGHGVGMSQYGANGMAKTGYTYKEILQHYYSGVSVF